MTTRVKAPGEFCWINILTPQPDAARAFFADILGWTYGEIPGMGHFIKVGDCDAGGIFPNVGRDGKSEMHPMIGVMVKVASADAAAAKFRELGGAAEDPFDVGESGRMAVCHDPNGAQIDVWQPKRGGVTEVDSSLPGAPSWFETLTTDTDRAAKFYHGVFGWTAETSQMGDLRYTVFNLGSTPMAGMCALEPEKGAGTPRWDVYFTVTDPDATLTRAKELGAKVDVPARDIPGVGRLAGLTSPQGVFFYVMRYEPRAMAVGAS